MTTPFFARIREAAEVRRLLREAGRLIVLTGPNGAGTSALLMHEYACWSGSKLMFPVRAHDGSSAALLCAFHQALGFETSFELTTAQRERRFVKLASQTLAEEVLFVVDDAPPDSLPWLRALAEEVTMLRILATSRTAGAASDAVRVEPFSTTSPEVGSPSEAAGFLQWKMKTLRPGWTQGRSDGAVMEEIVELVGGNARLLSQIASIAVDDGLPSVLERVRKRSLRPSTSMFLEDAVTHLSRPERVMFDYLRVLPMSIARETLDGVFDEWLASDAGGDGLSDVLMRLQAIGIVTVDDEGAVSLVYDCRKSIDDESPATKRRYLERTANTLLARYARLESALDTDLHAAVSRFRADQSVLCWLAATIEEPELCVRTAMVLARFAVYANQSGVERTLEVALDRWGDTLEEPLRIEATFRLADAFLALGNVDGAEPLADVLVASGSPRARAIGFLLRARLRASKGEVRLAAVDNTEAHRLCGQLSDAEHARAKVTEAIISHLRGAFDQAAMEFRHARKYAESHRFSVILPEIVGWSARNETLRLEFDTATALVAELEAAGALTLSPSAQIAIAAHRWILPFLRGNIDESIAAIQRGCLVAKRSGLRLDELDMLLGLSFAFLVSGDKASQAIVLDEAQLVAADWAAPPRIIATLHDHRLAQALRDHEIDADSFAARLVSPRPIGDALALIALAGSMDPSFRPDDATSRVARTTYSRLQPFLLAPTAVLRQYALALDVAVRPHAAALGLKWVDAVIPDGAIGISVDGGAVLVGARTIDLSSRPILRKLVAVLASRRNSERGAAVSSAALIATLWPGEKMLPKAASNRLHVAIADLRSAGLAQLIVSSRAGYFLDPAVPIVRIFWP